MECRRGACATVTALELTGARRFCARLAGVFQVEDSLRYRSWKVDEQEMALVVQVVLAAFIHDTHEVILGGPRIRNDPVDLAWNERRLVIGVIDTQSKWLCRLFHFASKYLLIFKSRFPIPWASYQCNSTSRRAPFGRRTVAIPFSRHAISRL